MKESVNPKLGRIVKDFQRKTRELSFDDERQDLFNRAKGALLTCDSINQFTQLVKIDSRRLLRKSKSGSGILRLKGYIATSHVEATER